MKISVLAPTLVSLSLVGGPPSVLSFAPALVPSLSTQPRNHGRRTTQPPLYVVSDESTAPAPQSAAPPPPPAILNGKRVMPATIIKAGLKGQDTKLAGVYALLSGDYTKGTEGWDAVLHVGVSQDLKLTLDSLNVEFKHVRALSFSFPQPNAMQDVAENWKQQAMEAGAELQSNVVDASNFLFDDDDRIFLGGDQA